MSVAERGRAQCPTGDCGSNRFGCAWKIRPDGNVMADLAGRCHNGQLGSRCNVPFDCMALFQQPEGTHDPGFMKSRVCRLASGEKKNTFWQDHSPLHGAWHIPKDVYVCYDGSYHASCGVDADCQPLKGGIGKGKQMCRPPHDNAGLENECQTGVTFARCSTLDQCEENHYCMKGESKIVLDAQRNKVRRYYKPCNKCKGRDNDPYFYDEKDAKIAYDRMGIPFPCSNPPPPPSPNPPPPVTIDDFKKLGNALTNWFGG